MSSKRYKEAFSSTDLTKEYSIGEAIQLLSNMPAAKFDETLELSAHLGVDPKHSDQMVRGIVSLPRGSGKKVRVLAFTDNAQAAIEAGADYAGLEDMMKKVQEGWTDFDVAVATPAAMKEVRNLARVLGPRGLMPNPKSGTVTEDIAEGIRAVKAGRVEFKMDKTANVAIVIGKRSFTAEDIETNAIEAIDALMRARPSGLKGGRYILSLTFSSTMSPGIKISSAGYTKHS
jgi:large subunit ribosomal protein L1